MSHTFVLPKPNISQKMLKRKHTSILCAKRRIKPCLAKMNLHSTYKWGWTRTNCCMLGKYIPKHHTWNRGGVFAWNQTSSSPRRSSSMIARRIFLVAYCNRNVLQSYVIDMLKFLIRGFLFGDVINRTVM